MNSLELLGLHTVKQLLSPEKDRQQWIAFQHLRVLYPELVYTSIDGYTCDGIADYYRDLSWIHKNIYVWSTWNKDNTVIYKGDKDFWDMNSDEIFNVWISVVNKQSM